MGIPIKVVDTLNYEPGDKDPNATVTEIWDTFRNSFEGLSEREYPKTTPNVPCGTCTACCTDIQNVELSPGDDQTLIFEEREGKRFIPRTSEGHCIYLGDKGCNVYERRPVTCRVFDCRLYQIGGIIYSEGSENLNTAIMNWDIKKLYQTHEDKLRGIATRMAMERFKEFPDSEIAGNPMIAFASHESFLDKTKKYVKELLHDPKQKR